MRMRTAEEMQALRRQVVRLRDELGMSFPDIAERLYAATPSTPDTLGDSRER